MGVLPYYGMSQRGFLLLEVEILESILGPDVHQIGGTAIELLTSASTFWKKTGTVYQEENPRDPNAKSGRTREALKNKLTWIFALFIFGYVGAEGMCFKIILSLFEGS